MDEDELENISENGYAEEEKAQNLCGRVSEKIEEYLMI